MTIRLFSCWQLKPTGTDLSRKEIARPSGGSQALRKGQPSLEGSTDRTEGAVRLQSRCPHSLLHPPAGCTQTRCPRSHTAAANGTWTLQTQSQAPGAPSFQRELSPRGSHQHGKAALRAGSFHFYRERWAQPPKDARGREHSQRDPALNH